MNNKIHSEAPPKTAFKFFLSISKPHAAIAVSAIVFVVLASGLGQGTSYFFKLIVDAVEKGDLQQALLWGMLYPVAILFVQILFRLSGVFGATWSNKARKTGVDNINNYILSHSHNYYADRFAGSVTNKIRNVVDAVENSIPDFLWAHLNASVSFLVTFLLISSVDIMAGSLFIILLFVLIYINRKMAPRKAVLSKANAEAGTALQGRLVDTIGNVTAVRQYAKTEDELEVLEELTEDKKNKGLKNWLYTERMLFINSFVLFAFSFLIFWILINRWGAGMIGAGDFVLVLALVSQISGTLLFIGRAFNSTARMLGEMREGLEDLIVPHEITDHPNATKLLVNKGEISWENVSFAFSENGVFKKFNLNIPGQQRVGLVGRSGAGKSTFVSLLLRQHELDAGQVKIDGQDISQVTQKSLRENISIVPQEPFLFHRSLRENIAYAKPEATDEEIEDVAKLALAHDFIMDLPDGYDTLVGERGVKLSGGQRQRIAIARAMLKNAPILLLDEATSALDSDSEKAIQKALHTLMQGKTVIAIAHRLSTLREMNRIILMEAGNIVEDGSHDELIEANGNYKRLWTHQTGGYLKDA